MEVEYLIERLGPYLGGIDVEKIKEVLRGDTRGVERLLGIEGVSGEYAEELECMRIRAFVNRYLEEEKGLLSLYRELKSKGVAPSDMESLRRRLREVRRRIRLYKEMSRKCQGRSVSSSVRPQG
ncbi:hypothetical protein [Pyrobaculum aerophilum]|uniref:Uncharacterized protein n=1 Tax=Pyrobaculum aerophilum TaxID=13773 RepID=A0A371R2Q5_9CREN|nr:hypothetical protein [Pyrobaculum aerophilum]RFA94922.1 hypothetical protein CGL51_08910 [Pyrobaculum aerophilum]RFA98024.1 hypothetical protein CGL52_08180 [Pyrobaculum aerophilum]